MNDRLLKALAGKNSGRPPVWIMRQAGRILPDYRAMRERFSLGELFRTPELAATVTKLPIEILGVDAAILFADILLIWEPFQLLVDYPEKGAPKIGFTPEKSALKNLRFQSVKQKLDFVAQAIKLSKEHLDVPLIGFCGAPFTVLSFLLGKDQVIEWIKKEPRLCHDLLQKLTDASIEYLHMQIDAGVDAIQIFESLGSLLTLPQLNEFSLPYQKQMVDAIDKVPVILFARGSSLHPREYTNLKPAAISFDWDRHLWDIRREVPQEIAVQGNLDPSLLKISHEQIVDQVENLLERMKGESGFIVNLGHGVLPDTPLENVQCFVNAVLRCNQCSLIGQK